MPATGAPFYSSSRRATRAADDTDVIRLNQPAMVFVGLAVSPRASRKKKRQKEKR